MQKMTPCLWVENSLDEVFAYYQSIFKEAKVISKQGIGGEMEILGTRLQFLMGGPMFKFNEAISLVISCDDQEEVDYYWAALIANGGAESMCGWCKDKYGLSWQVVPKKLYELLSSSDQETSTYAMQEMLKMRKIIITDLTQVK